MLLPVFFPLKGSSHTRRDPKARVLFDIAQITQGMLGVPHNLATLPALKLAVRSPLYGTVLILRVASKDQGHEPRSICRMIANNPWARSIDGNILYRLSE